MAGVQMCIRDSLRTLRTKVVDQQYVIADHMAILDAIRLKDCLLYTSRGFRSVLLCVFIGRPGGGIFYLRRKISIEGTHPDACLLYTSKSGINVTIRREMGADIDGACGQLRRRYADSTKAE